MNGWQIFALICVCISTGSAKKALGTEAGAVYWWGLWGIMAYLVYLSELIKGMAVG